MSRRTQRGFSLIELMIVLAIILIISVIAIPSYLRARQAAYEASAVGFAHAVQTDQAAYKATHGTYATSFSDLPGYAASAAGQNGSGGSSSGSSGGSSTPSAQSIAGGFGMNAASGGSTSTVIRNSYAFTMVTPDADQWYLTGFPLEDRVYGLYIYADSTGQLKSQKGGLPTDSNNLHAQ